MAYEFKGEGVRKLYDSVMQELAKGVEKDGSIPGVILYRKNRRILDDANPSDSIALQLGIISRLEEMGLSPHGVSIKSRDAKRPLSLLQTTDYVIDVIERSARVAVERGM